MTILDYFLPTTIDWRLCVGIIGLLVFFIGLTRVVRKKKKREKNHHRLKEIYDFARHKRLDHEFNSSTVLPDYERELQKRIQIETGALICYLQFLNENNIQDFHLEQELRNLLERIPA